MLLLLHTMGKHTVRRVLLQSLIRPFCLCVHFLFWYLYHVLNLCLCLSLLLDLSGPYRLLSAYPFTSYLFLHQIFYLVNDLIQLLFHGFSLVL